MISHKDGNATITFTSDGKVKIKGAEIWIGDSATEALVKGDTLENWLKNTLVSIFNAHVHSGVTTGPGSSGAPTVPLTNPVGIKSANHKVE